MIALSSLPSTLQNRLKKMTLDEMISVRTWKGDRGMTIYCLGDDLFSIEEDGFQSAIFNHLSRQEVLKQAKIIAHREFPRSNKLRFQQGRKDKAHG